MVADQAPGVSRGASAPTNPPPIVYATVWNKAENVKSHYDSSPGHVDSQLSSVNCHYVITQCNLPTYTSECVPLNPSQSPVLDLPPPEGWKAELPYVVGYVPRWFTGQKPDSGVRVTQNYITLAKLYNVWWSYLHESSTVLTSLLTRLPI